MIITSCGNSVEMAKNAARSLGIKFCPLEIKAFPDGDIYLKYTWPVKGKTVVIIHSFQPNPDMSLFDVIFAAETAKDLEAKRVVLIAPYLAYMRQDKRFHYGEAINSKIMAKLLNNSIDEIITIDPHLHRYGSLKDIFMIRAVKLTANRLIEDYIQKNIPNCVIVGPDAESYQWAEEVAERIGVEATVLKKTRYTSRHVDVKVVKPIPIKGKNAVIVDDIISTGHTIAEAAKKIRRKGAKTITAIGVHGLFVEDAISKLKKAGVTHIITCNTVEHETNKIDVTGLIVDELKGMKGDIKK